jgi:YhcH/YjgK/YiaL family protein
MIIDKLINAHLYNKLSPRIKKALDYLRQTNLSNTANGKYEIDGSNIYAMVQQYATKARNAGKWEAHRKYIDVQFIVRGTEQIGHTNINRLVPGQYDSEKDVIFFTGEGDYLTLSTGDFMILFPEDAHKPCIAASTPGEVKKVVVKIAVE